MSGPMGALGGAWPMIIDDVSVKRDHVSKNGRDKNAQYLLDHRCDSRRYCRTVVFGASLTPQLDGSSESRVRERATSRASPSDSCYRSPSTGLMASGDDLQALVALRLSLVQFRST
jgi:hypothetical protein